MLGKESMAWQCGVSRDPGASKTSLSLTTRTLLPSARPCAHLHAIGRRLITVYFVCGLEPLNRGNLPDCTARIHG